MSIELTKRLLSVASTGAVSLTLGICLAGSAGADPMSIGKVADAADYMGTVSASHVEDVTKNICMPFEQSPDNLPPGDMVYADRRGFSNVGMFANSNAWVRPLSVGGIEAHQQPAGAAISLRVKDTFGNASRVAVADLPKPAQDQPTQAVNAPQATSTTRSRSFWNNPQIVDLVERVQRTATSLSGTSNNMAFGAADSSAPGFRMGFIPVRPGHSNAIEAGVFRMQNVISSGAGLAMSAEFIPAVTDGINQNLGLQWGSSSQKMLGGVRFSGGHVAGSNFRMTTLTQNLPLLPHARSSVAWSNFAVGGRQYSEAIFTSAFAAGPRSEFGVGFAMQQSGSSPFLSYARPLGKTGTMSVALGAPNSIATRAPFTVQLSCPL